MATIQGTLREATARTEAVMADPDATAVDRYLAAVREEGVYQQIEPGPCDRTPMTLAAECKIDYSAELAAEAADGPDLEAAI